MSTHRLLAAYLRERLRPRLFLPLSVVLAFAGWCLAPAAVHLGAFVGSALEAFVLCAALRVVDDVRDREYDRMHHPGRVMSSAGDTVPFQALSAALLVVGVVALLASSQPARRLGAIAMCAGVLALWYVVRPSENWHRAFGEHVVLLKYPLIAYAAAPGAPPEPLSAQPLLVLAALYVLVCLGAYVDDPELRPFFLTRRPIP